MPRLAISKDFPSDYARLDRQVQVKVDELFAKFRAATHSGIHLEKHEGQRDTRARTVRVGLHHRGIVIAPDEGDLFVLARVLTHDESNQWMARNEFRINEATGALEVFDVVELQQALDSAPVAATAHSVYEHRKDKEFTQLGIESALVPALRRFESDDEIEAFVGFLPEMQREALIDLLGNESVDEIFARLVSDTPVGKIDTADIEAALERPVSQVTFHVITSDDELHEILAWPFAKWRVFLHPSQRKLAYRPTYNGPVRVTGGPGTGKTVVAMHRAKALADTLTDRSGKPILFTTFTRNLARAIENDLKQLGGTELLEVVDVVHLDRLANSIVRDAEGQRPRVPNQDEQRRRWQDAVDETGISFEPEFVAKEWEIVVLGQGLDSRDGYLRAPRAGRGVRLDRRQRLEVWRAIEVFTQRLAADGARTFLQLSAAAAGYVKSRTVKPYRHVVVDEAQDLHEAQWKLIRALVDEGANDLFIVGDSHQRIYDNRASLGKVGINIRGRSHRLRMCYRTTRQILRWSLALVEGQSFDDLDDGEDTLSGYHAQLSGPPPVLRGSKSRAEELDALTEIVKGWIDGGVDPSEIGVAARTGPLLAGATDRLMRAGISTYLLEGEEDMGGPTQVRMGTMHRMKGLEFRCIAVIDVDDDNVPLHLSLVSAKLDAVEHDAGLRRERCLLYVACTRARDALAVLWVGKPSRFLPKAS